ncbi:MAG TPA: radical SAM protein [Polyangiaceae bacterium]|nr:radical SAM protein [Polyangiaceae bacterium]
MSRPLVAALADALWPAVRAFNARFERPSPKPGWAPGPLLKSRERSYPPLGFPRETDSLCPACVKEVRAAVLDGTAQPRSLAEGRPAEVRARIEERGGAIVMSKTCPRHGPVEDVLSVDPAFTARIERLFPGRDYLAPATKLRDHGSSSIKWGRGSVLTVDLTNRCNMMCDPCFMDANQVGFVHELAWEEVEKILGDAMSIEPRRQMSVQFSGGEPTLSPHFLRAVRHAKDIGFFCVQAATNGIRFAQDPDFARAAKDAGLRLAYLQFDGVGEEANAHRKVGNLFDVKLRAIENLHAVGIDVVLVVTVVRGVNDDQVGRVVRFAIDNADKITVVSFQPVSFTGRDEDIADEERRAKRYTLSHLAHDLARQLGATEPMRDWFPLSALGPFGDLTDLLLAGSQGEPDWGALKCGCHPNCGIGTAMLVHKRTKQMVPLAQVLDVEGLLEDIREITDAAQPRAVTLAQLAVALCRRFDARRAPRGFGLATLLRQFMSQTGARGERIGEHASDAHEFEWRVLFVAGMWFQDLFNYDFRRTEMCIIPYGTQEGEISFCAYNTGVGWRQVVEKMHATATVADWYKTRGRHKVYAKNQKLELPHARGTVRLPIIE